MYKKIMVPVDLGHVERLEKALTTAADLSNHYRIPLCYVGVSAATPGSLAHNPHEFEAKMKSFGEDQAKKFSLDGVSTETYISHDPTIDLDATLLRAVEATGADLVVMASHVPGLAEHLFASNAGYVAMHSKASVFVVR
ncbi:MAG: universal stress protein [Proteobacteria bacterium]|nr:MAG: universal stress protein [Pseudomonadota bacterium]